MNNLKSYLIPVSESLSKDYITKNAVVKFFNKKWKVEVWYNLPEDRLKEGKKAFKEFLKNSSSISSKIESQFCKEIMDIGWYEDLVEDNKNNINTFGLTDEESLQVIDWFPVWEANVELKTAEKISYNGKLYETLQDHTSQNGWEPSINTASLFKEVAINDTFGTKDNPIEYNNNMALESGKYYIQNNITYLCTRDTGTAVYNDLAALIDIYVIIAS